MSPRDPIAACLRAHRDVWLIGAGGKTTLMYRLAAAWAAVGERVLCATTTRIRPPAPAECADLRLGDLASIVADLRRRPAPVVTVAAGLDAAGKCRGFAPDDTLSLLAVADRLVVEADGAAGRPLKAHAPDEPVIAPGASCVVAVVGGWCVGAPLDAAHVHRPERFATLSGRRPGEPVTADDVARAILRADGWLSAVPPAAAFHVAISGEDPGIRRALEAHPAAGRIAAIHGLGNPRIAPS